MDSEYHPPTTSLVPETPCPSSGRKEPLQPSMLYTILPGVIQNRLPMLPSLRRSISGIRGHAIHVKNTVVREESRAPETPPPTYSSRPSSRPASIMTDDSVVSTETGETRDQRSNISTRDSSPSPSYSPLAFPLAETGSGVNWKFANQGVNLMNQAVQESILQTHDVNGALPTLTRQLYIHGLTYLLRGLPSNLSSEEILSIQASISKEVADISNHPDTHALIPLSDQMSMSSPTAPPQDRSVLHKITAIIVFQTFIMIQFLLPYIKLLISHAYRFEREHRVSQRIFSTSIQTVDEVGRRSLKITQTVCQMNDGKVGQAINDLTIWWLRSVTGGIQQGISDGMVTLGSERQDGKA